ncbi:MAG: hypothetical protein ACREOD_01005 [Candidatus Dormibacteria bacterium]
MLGGLGKGAAFSAVLGLVGLAGALTAQVVGAWTYTVSTDVYTSSTVPTTAPGVASTANPTTASPGEYISDSATIPKGGESYILGGTVTFDLYSGTPPPSCSGYGTPLTEAALTVNSTMSVTPAPTDETVYSYTAGTSGYFQVPSTAASGTNYYWVAAFKDSENSIFYSSCSSEEVTVVVPKSSTQISTSVQGLPITLQQSDVTNPNKIFDMITLSGATDLINNQVTVTLEAVSGSSSVHQTYTVTLTQSGANWVGQTPDFVPEAAGQFCYAVSFAGDANNSPASSACGQEGFTVNQYPASLVTYPVTPVTSAVGMVLDDTAVMNIYPNHQAMGGSGQYGSVTFGLYTDSSCSNQVTAGGSALGATEDVLWVSSASEMEATVSLTVATPLASGTYYWLAAYSGNYDNTAYSTCGEPTTIAANIPSISTTPSSTSVTSGTSVYDAAQVTGLVAPASTDSVDFQLVSDCTASPSYSKDLGSVMLTISGGTGSASSPSMSAPAAGTYYWLAIFSGDANNASVSESCGTEKVVVTSTGGGSGTLGASTTSSSTPGTGADLFGPGLAGALTLLLGGLLLIAGRRWRRLGGL